MKNYYDRNYRLSKSRSYLYTGLVMTALSLIMIVVSIHSVLNGAEKILVITGFTAGAVWAFAAVSCFIVYYRANRVEIEQNTTKTNKKNSEK